MRNNYYSFRQICRFLLLLFGIQILGSCVTNKKTTYLQEYRSSEYSTELVAPEDYLIKPNDNLYIRISTPDPRFSSLFNVSDDGGSMSGSEANVSLFSYPVMLDGKVELPYIGFIEVSGKTVTEAKAIIEIELTDYVTDAAITVRLVNNYITVLGEVNAPGLYPIYKEHLNVFQAIAMAGDLGEFSDRFSVKIIRQTDEGSVIKEFSITDQNIIDSEFYYVMPNDVIYAGPMKGKFFRMNQFPITMLLSTVTALVSLAVLIQNFLIIQSSV